MALLRYLVFENSTTLWVVLVIAAVICGTIWRRTGAPGARVAAIACVTVGVVIGILAWLVETDHERLARTIRTMSSAVATGRADVFIERISPEYRGGPLGKETMAEVVRLGLKQVRADAADPGIAWGQRDAVVTQVYRFYPAPGSQMALPPGAERVVWEGTFAPDADGEWRLRSAMATQPRRVAPEEALHYLPGARKP